MPKEFKCPICGCTEHFKTEVFKEGLFGLVDLKVGLYFDPGESFYLKENFEAFICKQCGHIDLFNEAMAKEMTQHNDEIGNKIKHLNSEIKGLNTRIEAVEKQLEPYKNKINGLKELLKSEDITVRQQKEYQQELDSFSAKNGDQIRKLSRELNSLKNTVAEKQEMVEQLKTMKV